jgi:hypothetical protein
MRNISDNIWRKSKHILGSIIFSPENRAVYDIMWKNIVQADRSQMPI